MNFYFYTSKGMVRFTQQEFEKFMYDKHPIIQNMKEGMRKSLSHIPSTDYLEKVIYIKRDKSYVFEILFLIREDDCLIRKGYYQTINITHNKVISLLEAQDGN